MVKRNNNQLPHNLPQLQNLIKRDPESYKEEFFQQYNQYKSLIEIFKAKPEDYEKQLDDLLMFLAQVSHLYIKKKKEGDNDDEDAEDDEVKVKNYPKELMDILEKYHSILDPDMRMSFCKALVLLRSKNFLSPVELLPLFFKLLNCQDKNLRQYLETQIITDIKNMNKHHKNGRLNTRLQNYMYLMLNDSNSKAVKMSIDIMIELYRKNIWNDAKTVNVIASGCFSKYIKVMVAALKFFLGNDEDNKDGSDSDSDSDSPTAKDVVMANKVNKKTRKRENQLKKVKQAISKKKKKNKPEVFNFSALHLVHDPQSMAERLLARSAKGTDRFEVRLMALDVASRLIGVHQLIVLNLYPQLQRLLRPQQREATHLLRCAAQAAHPLVPPDILEPVLRTMADNFVTERNNNDAIAIGLNAIRELCARCPLAMNQDLLHDLVQYSNFRERSVSMAAKSLVKLFRVEAPELLRRKDRGRPTQLTANKRLLAYGETDATDHVPGADILDEHVPAEAESESDSDSGESWVNVDDDDDQDEINISDSDEESNKKGNEENKPNPEKAQQVSTMRILTDEDFKKIETARLRSEITPFSRKRSLPQDETDGAPKEIVSMADIENIYKKRRHDKDARLEKIREEQKLKEKHGHRDKRVNTSSTNREKSKKKNFLMVKHKVRGKVKKSFKDKQIALRNHLIKLKKMK